MGIMWITKSRSTILPHTDIPVLSPIPGGKVVFRCLYGVLNRKYKE
jgi:hypothetical protein